MANQTSFRRALARIQRHLAVLPWLEMVNPYRHVNHASHVDLPGFYR